MRCCVLDFCGEKRFQPDSNLNSLESEDGDMIVGFYKQPWTGFRGRFLPVVVGRQTLNFYEKKLPESTKKLWYFTCYRRFFVNFSSERFYKSVSVSTKKGFIDNTDPWVDKKAHDVRENEATTTSQLYWLRLFYENTLTARNALWVGCDLSDDCAQRSFIVSLAVVLKWTEWGKIKKQFHLLLCAKRWNLKFYCASITHIVSTMVMQ